MGYREHLVNKTVGMEVWAKEHQSVTQQLKELLRQAQERMKRFADTRRSERIFQEGDWVYLKLKPYKQLSLRKSRVWKLAPKFCGPFMVLKKIGEVAYELQLPRDAKVHPIFHVSQLKRKVGKTDSVVENIPALDDKNQFLLIPEKVIERRLAKKNNAAVTQWLVQWAHLPVEEASWEDAEEMMVKFPNLQP
ncbi:hypothetical protein ACP275_04G093400 [Erythranthe tilingii]